MIWLLFGLELLLLKPLALSWFSAFVAMASLSWQQWFHPEEVQFDAVAPSPWAQYFEEDEVQVHTPQANDSADQLLSRLISVWKSTHNSPQELGDSSCFSRGLLESSSLFTEAQLYGIGQ